MSQLVEILDRIAVALEQFSEAYTSRALRHSASPRLSAAVLARPAGGKPDLDVSSHENSPPNAVPLKRSAASLSQEKWTPERVAAAIAMRANGADGREILKHINALPGPTIYQNELNGKLGRMKQMRQIPDPPVNTEEEFQSRVPGPVERTFDQVRQWAAERGIQFYNSDDLAQVNRKARELGLREFKLVLR